MTTPHPAVLAETPAPQRMLELIAGFWISRCIHAIARLGVPDLLKDGPKTAEALAQATDTHASSLFRVLRGLASVGILAACAFLERNFPWPPLLHRLYKLMLAVAIYQGFQEGLKIHNIDCSEQ